MKKHLYRITLLTIAAAVLSACPSKRIKNLPAVDTTTVCPVSTAWRSDGTRYARDLPVPVPAWTARCSPVSIECATAEAILS